MLKRIEAQFKQCNEGKQDCIIRAWKVEKVNDNHNDWLVKIQGQKTTPYEGGIFKLSIKLSGHIYSTDKYPHKFPQFKFLTKIFHPNIKDDGEVCQEMIGEKDWVPTKKIIDVINTIYGMMKAPNLDHPISQQAAKAFKQGKYPGIAAQWTKKYAK